MFSSLTICYIGFLSFFIFFSVYKWVSKLFNSFLKIDVFVYFILERTRRHLFIISAEKVEGLEINLSFIV